MITLCGFLHGFAQAAHQFFSPTALGRDRDTVLAEAEADFEVYEPTDLVERLRATLDAELAAGSFTMTDDYGHVELVDGDVDTLEIARAIVAALRSHIADTATATAHPGGNGQQK